MKVQFTQILLVVIALLLVQLVLNLKPATVSAQGQLKIVKVGDYVSGPILGFSCVANNTAAACYILTK